MLPGLEGAARSTVHKLTSRGNSPASQLGALTKLCPDFPQGFVGPFPPQPAPCATAAWEGMWLWKGYVSRVSVAESLVERCREDRPAHWRCGLSSQSAVHTLPGLFVVL